MGQYDKALGFHTQELNLRQELNDLRGECKAHGNLGNVHVSLGNYIQGYKVSTAGILTDKVHVLRVLKLVMVLIIFNALGILCSVVFYLL